MTRNTEPTPIAREEVGYFSPDTWMFWRCILICFAVFAMVGHWLEIPYVNFMDQFGIVDEDYAALSDPWYVPYWVYGFGAVAMTFIIEPFKEIIIRRTNTIWQAVIVTFLFAAVLAAILETGIGLVINQPDIEGIYPFWDNSELPLNILGQGWVVNDIVIGVVAVVYLWVLYPLIFNALKRMPPVAANIVFAAIMVGFGLCVLAAYVIWPEYTHSFATII